MWYIQEESRLTKGPKYWLGGRNSTGRTIGRKLVDIRLKASSVSRIHARLTVHKASFYAPTGTHRQTTVVCVVDSSAYGTFLKYPKNHVVSREEPAGHHRRLNKGDLTEVYEGALLAFGAPSAWWRVCWYPILVLPSRLPNAARTRLQEVAEATSLEVTDNMSENVTHLVTSSCVSTSQKFLLMLARDVHVVQPAWLEALHMVVLNACNAVAIAESDEIASAATCLPHEDKYLPPFSEADAANYVPDVLQNVWKPSQREKRHKMFENIVFAFEAEHRCSWWAPIINLLGGVTILSKVLNKRPQLKGKRVLHLGDQELEGTKHEQEDIRKVCEKEKDLIECILRADLAPIESALDDVREELFRPGNTRVDIGSNPQKSVIPLGGAEVTDVATPGPLDADSDVESDVSGAAETYRASSRGNSNNFSPTTGARREAGRLEKTTSKSVPKWKDLKIDVQDFESEADPQQKRVRSGVHQRESNKGNDNPEEDREIGPRIVSDSALGEGIEFDGEKDNERVFFPVSSAPSAPGLNSTPVDGRDVRPFRRRKLPSASTLPLKRVKALDETNLYNVGGRRHLLSREESGDQKEIRD
eukprot:TRINITY_DN1723_c0_g1_i1.p1 TRINITY_DN1723_c0_g1~~TRINITY_DN1723_c0_g1_i1.p1  ORF type:complete len:588 (+),score=70.33 TRINITY_DN1723_c0_g1_i1:150-1913(+)